MIFENPKLIRNSQMKEEKENENDFVRKTIKCI